MKPIKKAIIPAAGLGTRFLPATKNIPKEMLPIVDRPALLYNVEEAVRAGIEDIVIIAGRGKSAIEDFFDRSYELEDVLIKSHKEELLIKIKSLREMANIISVRQKEALGLGHAILSGRPVVGDEPFAVLLGDEIMIGDPGVTAELCQSYRETNISTVAVMEVATSEISKYGIVALDPSAPAGLIHTPRKPVRVVDVVEKPNVDSAPSRMALPGRYVFSPNIFTAIANSRPGHGGEFQLTDAMRELARSGGIMAQTFTDRRFDTGDKLGFIVANIELALEHPELSEKLKHYLKNRSGLL